MVGKGTGGRRGRREVVGWWGWWGGRGEEGEGGGRERKGSIGGSRGWKGSVRHPWNSPVLLMDQQVI